MNTEESNKHYESSINQRIKELKSRFDFVYHVMHPFKINIDAPSGIHNEKLEERIFEYQVTNIVLKYFGTLEGFSKSTLKSPDDILADSIFNSFKLKDTRAWFTISRNEENLDPKQNVEFFDEIHKVAEVHFTNSDDWDHYTDDDEIDSKFWNWEYLTWRALCIKLDISFDSSIRFSRILKWINDNGYPINIKFPLEWMDEDTQKAVENIAVTKSTKLEIYGNHDAYVTIVGCSEDISNELKNLSLEFTVETDET